MIHKHRASDIIMTCACGYQAPYAPAHVKTAGWDSGREYRCKRCMAREKGKHGVLARQKKENQT